MKIGNLVRAHIKAIFDCCDADELMNLMDKRYSKDAFDINFPFCVELQNIPHERYWKDTYVVLGRRLRVCSQWYEESRAPFCRYIISKGIADPDDVFAPYNLPLTTTPRPTSRPTRMASSWPEWKRPSDEELLQLAKIAIPYIHFLHPDIIRDVVRDNEYHREEWSDRLKERGIDPARYLWQNSPCAFPGVRRYAGSDEIAQFRGRMVAEAGPKDALKLDDNDYPKHIWSFVFRGKGFQKKGPLGYSLAHLVDHKDYKNRQQEELDDTGNDISASTLFGLYTSVTNTVYMPNSLIRPTDFSFLIRSLIQRKADSIYGSFCKLLPPHRSLRINHSEAWLLDAFDWHEPVGTADHVQAFLTYRNKEMEMLFEAAKG
jgi:hypothetical protein